MNKCVSQMKLCRGDCSFNKEINFYKGIMVPNAAEKGLRIERVNISPYAGSKARYSILLTQVVDKHNFVQGNVEISIEGTKIPSK